MNDSVVSLAGMLLIVVCVLLLAYWSSRFLGKNYVKAASGRNMKILEQLRIGTDKQIILLKLRSEVYLIGVSQAGIERLACMEDDFSDPAANGDQGDSSNFRNFMERYSRLHQKKKGEDK